MSGILESAFLNLEPLIFSLSVPRFGVLSLKFYISGLRISSSKDISFRGLPNSGAGTSKGEIIHIPPLEALIRQAGQRWLAVPIFIVPSCSRRTPSGLYLDTQLTRTEASSPCLSCSWWNVSGSHMGVLP